MGVVVVSLLPRLCMLRRSWFTLQVPFFFLFMSRSISMGDLYPSRFIFSPGFCIFFVSFRRLATMAVLAKTVGVGRTELVAILNTWKMDGYLPL